ncbi:MAG TPA: type II toxin-antitoxin system RelE/ParE family toxin [Candidatus Paceibacterota bacterium]
MKIVYSRKAADYFSQLPQDAQRRISKKMRFYADQVNPLEYAKKLKGFELYRFRVGDYRLIFEASRQTILIVDVRKRDDVYRDL